MNKIKIFKWLNIILSALALILECMPRSVIYATSLGGREYKIEYFAYFAKPNWTAVWFFTLMIGILTIIILLLNILHLIKDKKSLLITSTVLLSIAYALNSFTSIVSLQFATIYNILISSALLTHLTINVFMFRGNVSVENKKIEILNVLTVLALVITIIMECVPNSLRIDQKFNLTSTTSSDIELPYFTIYIIPYLTESNLMELLALIVALLTLSMLVFGYITVSKHDNKGLCITTLIMSSICAILGLAISIMAGRRLTPYNIIILILNLAVCVLQSIKLKISYGKYQRYIE